MSCSCHLGIFHAELIEPAGRRDPGGPDGLAGGGESSLTRVPKSQSHLGEKADHAPNHAIQKRVSGEVESDQVTVRITPHTPELQPLEAPHRAAAGGVLS